MKDEHPTDTLFRHMLYGFVLLMVLAQLFRGGA